MAKQKTLALRSQVEERVKAGDAKFSDALELMAFLANLVGAEHLERFIPVAEAQNERPLTPAPARRDHGANGGRDDDRHPRNAEIPGSANVRRRLPARAHVARTERKSAARRNLRSKAPSKPPPKKPAPHPERSAPSEAAREQVIADAARLVQWGRKWYELPELIARMADRPVIARCAAYT